jgi:hypothetical protein
VGDFIEVTVKLKVAVESGAIVVGPSKATVGMVPPVWQLRQKKPLACPEPPTKPSLFANAGAAKPTLNATIRAA